VAGLDTPHSAPDDPNANADPSAGGQSSPGTRSRRRSPTVSSWFGALNQLDFDIDFFERLLARKPDAVEVLRVLAELVSKKGLTSRAVELDSTLVELMPDDFLARYNLACSLARAGRADEAIDALSRAILLGYDDLDHMESDPDLESLRTHPDFLALFGE
jgi:tetratricopeptide (TPR) repeat protein